MLQARFLIDGLPTGLVDITVKPDTKEITTMDNTGIYLLGMEGMLANIMELRASDFELAIIEEVHCPNAPRIHNFTPLLPYHRDTASRVKSYQQWFGIHAQYALSCFALEEGLERLDT